MAGLELRVLQYFLAVAREENITRAAQMLHITQPTLSRQLMQLEEELGATLFYRGRHNIVLTEAGMLLRRRAQELVALADKTRQEFMQHEEELTGQISLGSGEFRSAGALFEAIAAFVRLHPGVCYRLHSGNADDIRENIERGLLDFGVTMGEAVDIRKYEFLPLPGREEWGVLVPEDSPLAQKEAVTPEDLENIPLVTNVRESVQQSLGRWFGESYARVQIMAAGTLLYNSAQLARSGMGAALAIRLDCDYHGLKFLPFSPAMTNGTMLIWKKDQVFPPAAAAFLDFAKKYLKGMAHDEK